MTALEDALPLTMFFLNGARMPSMAEELATDLSTPRWRKAGSRRWGLAEARVEDMCTLYRGKNL